MKTKAYHGGAFFNAIGEDFSTMERFNEIISADVLDAWFPPTPHALAKIREYTEVIVKTSPPTHSSGLIQAISNYRNINRDNILVGGGSSDIMFALFPNLFNKEDTVAILDPMYGEYSHIFHQVVPVNLIKFNLKKENDFILEPQKFINFIEKNQPKYVVMVNPNSPTGNYMPKRDLFNIIRKFPSVTFFIDETYIDYIGKENSLERYVSEINNLAVIKSMSKVYGLSGARVAYLAAPKWLVERISPFIPPWSVSLFGQVAGVEALKDERYYKEKYQLTHSLRAEFILELEKIPYFKRVYDSIGNFFLAELDTSVINASKLVEEMRKKNIFIRNCDSMGSCFNDDFVRFAVKDDIINRKIINGLKEILQIPENSKILSYEI